MMKFIPVLMLLCSTAGFAATTVYKTVDENGVVSFSDKSPEEGEAEAEVLQINTAKPQTEEGHLANLEAMRETTDRMAADRRERERQRAELKKIAASKQAPTQVYTEYYPYPIYSRSYPHHGRPPFYPGYRPRPEHPIARPPMRRSSGTFSSSNSQLMRPIVSSRR